LAALVLTVLGTLVVVAAVEDLFHTIFHPAARGHISNWLAHLVWKAIRSGIPSRIEFAGPLAFVITVSYWAVSLIIGFALIYRSHLPKDFTFVSGLNPERYSSFLGNVAISVCSLMTLSSGAYPKELWIQLLMGVESILGFALLSASISWILSIYPVLEHRRSLAHQATLLHFAEQSQARRLESLEDSELEDLLLGLASQVTTHRNELTQFPITYYFYEEDKQTALPGILPYLADVASQYSDRNGGAGIAAITLGGAIDDYLDIIATAFLHHEYLSREETLREYAREQMREMVRAPERVRKAA
jgi:hypothetical protein